MKSSNCADAALGKDIDEFHDFSVTLSCEETAALEGWRLANNIPTTSEAARELLRLGLLSEISKVYGIVSAIRNAVDEDVEGPHVYVPRKLQS